MAQSSVQKKASLSLDPPTSYPVIDVVEVKLCYGAMAPGFILVPGEFRPDAPESLIGEVVVIEPAGRPGHGYGILAVIAGVRDHGTTTSLLVENWPEDFPPPQVGWNLRVPNAEGPLPERPKSGRAKNAV